MYSHMQRHVVRFEPTEPTAAATDTHQEIRDENFPAQCPNMSSLSRSIKICSAGVFVLKQPPS